MPDRPALACRLGTTDAVVIGLGSMIGVGIFGCLVLAAALPVSSVLSGVAVVGVGIAVYVVRAIVRRRAAPSAGDRR